MNAPSIKPKPTIHSNDFSSQDQQNRFIELSTRLAELAKREGLVIRPFEKLTLPYFSAASYEKREHALQILSQTVKLTEEVQSQGVRARDSSSLIWAFCRTWRYAPTWDFHDKIQDGDMVDVYNLQGQLIFANLRFYEVTTYTLEQLYFCQWHILFNHEDEFQEQLQQICMDIPRKPHQTYDLRHLGEHRVKENFGKMEGLFQPTYFSSLIHKGKITGFVCINRVVEVTRNT